MSSEQQINLKFIVRLEKTPTKALNLLNQVYGDNAMSGACVFKLHKKFKEGRRKVEDDPRSGSLQPAEMMKTLNLCGRKCQVTVG